MQEAIWPARGGGTEWSWRSGRRGQRRVGSAEAEGEPRLTCLCLLVIRPQKKKHNYVGNTKECSNYRTTALISQASKVMLKILQARLQHHVN